MVNSITKKRFKNFMAYSWLKMIIVMFLVCVLLLLGFNYVERKPSDGQDFKLIIDEEVLMGDDVKLIFDELSSDGVENGGFSYEMLKGETIILRDADGSKNYNLNSLYCELYYDDVIVLAETTYDYYYKNDHAVDLPSYVQDAKNFIISNGFLNENGEFNTEKVNEYFIKTRGKDSRFRTEAEKEQGKIEEYKRLKAIWENANALEECFSKHPEILDQERSYDYYGLQRSGRYAINLGALKNGTRDIVNLFSITDYDELGYLNVSANGIYLSVGNNKDENGDLFYEQLTVLVKIIGKYSNFLD